MRVSRWASSARSKCSDTAPANAVPSIMSSRVATPWRSISRCSWAWPRSIRMAARAPSKACASSDPVRRARAAITRGSATADHIGNTKAQLWAGSGGKVQPPVRNECGACHCADVRPRRQATIGSSIGRIPSQDLPSECGSSAPQDRIESVGIRHHHRRLQPSSPICDRTNNAAASVWSGRSASIAARCSGTWSPSRTEGHCPSILPRLGRCWA